MSFGLKNVGATYQRSMDKVLAPILGRNVQAYIDDMVVTSQERRRHTADLEELFATIAVPSRGVDQKSKSTRGGTSRGPQRRERKSTG